MKPGETIRCTCTDCQIVFELFLAPVADWPEEAEDESDAEMEIVGNYPRFSPLIHRKGERSVPTTHGRVGSIDGRILLESYKFQNSTHSYIPCPAFLSFPCLTSSSQTAL